jgi:hypothetical protein
MQKQIRDDQLYSLNKDNSHSDHAISKVKWQDTIWGQMLFWVGIPFLIISGLLVIPGVGMNELLLGMSGIVLCLFSALMLWGIAHSIKINFSKRARKRK